MMGEEVCERMHEYARTYKGDLFKAIFTLGWLMLKRLFTITT